MLRVRGSSSTLPTRICRRSLSKRFLLCGLIRNSRALLIVRQYKTSKPCSHSLSRSRQIVLPTGKPNKGSGSPRVRLTNLLSKVNLSSSSIALKIPTHPSWLSQAFRMAEPGPTLSRPSSRTRPCSQSSASQRRSSTKNPASMETGLTPTKPARTATL